ncbi:MAG: DUF1295 domain-containing protein [Lachnospiraceae bacterium]|nr:DUF1295 domain-containing protein [Lachnospiraceae bacterium]
MLEMWITFLVALVLCSVGFVMYVYFFSVGYGFAIAGIGISMLIMFRDSLSACTVIMCLLFVVYGVRLGGYLAYREMKNKAYKKLLKGESKQAVAVGLKVSLWLACAFLYMSMCSPVLFRFLSGEGNDFIAVIGILLMAAGIAIEMVADWQKSEAKKVNVSMFVTTGLYKFVRCPNYFGELVLWTGVFISCLNILQNPLQLIIAILGYIGIVYVMFSGARRLELRQDRNYGHLESYQKYVRTTPIIIPLVPLYSVTKYKWLIA